MTRIPSKLPEWATGVGADIVEPSLGQKQDGWDVNDRPPAGWLNWKAKNVFDWSKLFKESLIRNFRVGDVKPAVTNDTLEGCAFHDSFSGVRYWRWVAVGNMATNGIYSSRGGLSQWVERTKPAGALFQWNDIIWDFVTSQFVNVGNATGTDASLATSVNGVSWIERANPKDLTLNGVASNGVDRLVAVGQADATDAYIITSPDSISWTERSNPKAFTLTDVCWSEDFSQFYAVGLADGVDAYMLRSADGYSWTEIPNARNVSLRGVAAGNGVVIAVGDGNGINTPYVLVSNDGINFSEVFVPGVGLDVPFIGNTAAYDICFAPEFGLFFAVTRYGGGFGGSGDDCPNVLFYTPDGVSGNWDAVHLPFNATATKDLRAISAGGNMLMIVGGEGIVLTSQIV